MEGGPRLTLNLLVDNVELFLDDLPRQNSEIKFPLEAIDELAVHVGVHSWLILDIIQTDFESRLKEVAAHL